MKLALLSDIHAILQAIQACLDHAEQQGASRFALLGDMVGFLKPSALVLGFGALVVGAAVFSTLRILDPSCGSGAFLVHVLERLAELLHRCGDGRSTSVIRRAKSSKTG